jgi:hypothetical protein
LRLARPFSALCLAILVAVGGRAVPVGSAGPPATAVTEAIGIVATGDPLALKQIGVSWYLTYSDYHSKTVAGMRHAIVVRLTPPPATADVVAAVRANPGAAWLIGNEPNVPQVESSDNLSPAEYAAALHELEPLIHRSDPSALVVGPNVLNWADSCTGCGGYRTGKDWTEAFYQSYEASYGTRPPLDRWGLHTYELDWSNTPMLHPDFDERQMVAFQNWLSGIPEEAGRPIWNTELGYNWAFPGWKLDAQSKVTPVGDYDTGIAEEWLNGILRWLLSDGRRLGIERTFLYAQAPDKESFQARYGGLTIFDAGTKDAPLTPLGQQLINLLRAPAAASEDTEAVQS